MHAKPMLIVSGRFGPRVGAAQVARALARGLQAAGEPAAEVWALDDGCEGPAQAAAAAMEERLRGSRGVILACGSLAARPPTGSAVFEIATRARQAGVPAYAVAASSALDEFEARMLDLQLVLVAKDERALTGAARRIAAVAGCGR